MESEQTNTSRLTEDDYVRPTLTYQDRLTRDEIEALLEDYIEIKSLDEFYKLPAKTQIRYFTNQDNKMKFRLGGQLHNLVGMPKYVVLVNNKKQTWCVQCENTRFFRRLRLQEIKDEYEEIIDELEKKEIVYVKKIKELLIENHELKKQLKRIHDD
jgi:hypothetical protein